MKIKWIVTIIDVWFTLWWFHFNTNDNSWYNWAILFTAWIINLWVIVLDI